MNFFNTPLFGSGKLKDGGQICTKCFKKLDMTKIGFNLKKTTLKQVQDEILGVGQAGVSDSQRSEPRIHTDQSDLQPVDSRGGLVSIQGQVPNRDLLFISNLPADRVPNMQVGHYVFEIRYENGVPYMTEKEQEKYDPSTIFTTLPVSKPHSIEGVPKPPYWPNYAGLTPEQRYVYLSWLRDITNPIDTGFVFVYYYGLERHLLFGDFDKAFNEIMTLRKHHKNKSFQKYSETALIYGSFYKSRIDLLLKDYEGASLGRFSNIQLQFAINNGLNLSLQNILSVFGELKLQRPPIKGYEELFEQCVSKVLKTEYGDEHFPLADKFDLKDIKTKKVEAFANYSFPEELRYPEVKFVLGHKAFVSEISRIFELAYEDFKKEKTILRKVEKDNLSEEERQKLKKKKEQQRLKKLFDKGVIRKDEYEMLLSRLDSDKPVK